MFYVDVPDHKWLLFGSHAKGCADNKSDLDVMLCGIRKADLAHPYFQDTLAKLRVWSVEENGCLDLFLDIPEENRIESIFSPEERAIDAGPEAYAATKAPGKELFVTTLFVAAKRAAAIGRDPITSQEEFIERQLSKGFTTA